MHPLDYFEYVSISVFCFSEMTQLMDSSAETRTRLTECVMIIVFVSAALPSIVAYKVLYEHIIHVQC